MASVTVRTVDDYRQEIIAGDHVVWADEPTDIGGDDTGPTPYELLLGALGACTSITLSMYARRKNWELRKVNVELEHSNNYRQDCEQCADGEVRLDHIAVRVSLEGELDDAQRKRLMEIAERCPVNQTLRRGMHIVHSGNDQR